MNKDILSLTQLSLACTEPQAEEQANKGSLRMLQGEDENETFSNPQVSGKPPPASTATDLLAVPQMRLWCCRFHWL